ncbi:MAG: site-specific integrase [Polyangia bacterium]
MGDIVRRGTRDNPKYYGRYTEWDGRRKMRLLKGARTKSEAQILLAAAELRVSQGQVGIEPLEEAPRCGPLMDEWLAGLTNRNAADDRNRFRRHVRSEFADVTLDELQTIAPIMDWIDKQKKAGKISDPSIRHNLNLFSRFFSWAIDHGHAAINPVRMIPIGKRPQQAQKRDLPWLKDDATVVSLMAALPEPVNLMFYLGNRSGLRTGELAGLRMSDLGYLKEGAIRVRYSYDGPLKEDKGQTGKMKWAPAPDDAEEYLTVWLKRRKLQGAGPESLVFPAPPSPNSQRRGKWLGFRKEFIKDCWLEAVRKVNEERSKQSEKPREKQPPLALTWYQATRHSFVTRNLEDGASLDEVSAAVGHSSPVVTKRYYDHHVRKTFSAALTVGLKRK